jgi:hypothetical protein
MTVGARKFCPGAWIFYAGAKIGKALFSTR